jgi:hypothetical protein
MKLDMKLNMQEGENSFTKRVTIRKVHDKYKKENEAACLSTKKEVNYTEDTPRVN